MSSGSQSLSTKTRRETEGAGEEREREKDSWLWTPFSARSTHGSPTARVEMCVCGRKGGGGMRH